MLLASLMCFSLDLKAAHIVLILTCDSSKIRYLKKKEDWLAKQGTSAICLFIYKYFGKKQKGRKRGNPLVVL
jgi:hypothetical protein